MAMISNWTPVITNVIAGGAVGFGDQIAQNSDEKRVREAQAAGKTLSMWKQVGTYLNFFAPAAALLLYAGGVVKGEWGEKSILLGSQLAGRKAAYKATKAVQSAPWRPAPNSHHDFSPVPQEQKPGFEKVGII